jgi:hypothetical protein
MKYKIYHSVCSIFLLIGTNVKGQQAVDNYKSFDFRNSSCEVFNSVNVELGKPFYADAFLSLKKQQQDKFPLQTQNNVDGFIKDFNLTLDITKKRYESQEFLWKTGKEIGKYGLSVLGNYAQALPTKHITNFLTPAIQQGYELYVDNEIRKGVDLHKNDIDKIIKDRINLLYTNGIDVRTANDEKAFKDMFDLAHGDIPALNREEYGIFNKELTKRAYDFIATNREQIKLIDLRTTQQYEDVKKQMNSRIQDFQTKITYDINSKFQDLGNSIVDLVKNQAEIFKTLDNIHERIKANEIKIEGLEKDMLRFKDNVFQLRAVQVEHSKLLAQNAFQIDILSGYTFQNLNTTQKINALDKGHFDNIFKDTEKEKLLVELNEIKTKETIISVSSDIENYSNAVYGGLVNTGILKGQAAKNVGKFISGVSFISGVARVYAGDNSGLTSIVSGLGGIFGGEPKTSPEMQMLTQMYILMNQRIDRIDQHLNIIETKLDTLASITTNMYKSMVMSFQYTGEQLERINRKSDYLLNQSSYQIFSDYKNCLDQKKVWETNSNEINSFSDIATNFNPICKKCLDGLNDFLAGEEIQAPFYLSANPNYKDIDVIDFEINEVYKPTRDLFSLFYDLSTSKPIYALMFPFSMTKDANKPLYYLHNMDSLKAIKSEYVFNEYLNYQLINDFANNLITYSSFYLVQSNSGDFKPQSINEYLTNNSLNKNNQTLQENRLLKTLNLIQNCIAQQSMLSGNLMLDPIYSTLFSFSADENAKELSIKTLNNNKLLANNFAIYLINKNLDFSDTLKVQRIYQNASTDSVSLNALNTLVTLNDIKFKVDADTKKLQLTFNRNGQNINIICPEFTTILENKMMNSDAIYTLLESRQKVNSKLIDLTFTKNIQSTNSMNEKFKYYYNTTSK